MKNQIEIQHRPFGDHHPYEISSDEQSPRKPFTNEIVEIGFLTRPVGAVKDVAVIYWIDQNKDEKYPIEPKFIDPKFDDLIFTDEGHLSEAAARAGLIVDVDNWKAVLPSFPPGSQVFYQIIVKNDDDKVQSKVFDYVVRKRIYLDKVVKIIRGQESVVVLLENSKENKSGYIRVSDESNGCIELTSGFGEYSPDEKKEDIPLNIETTNSIVIPLGTTIFHINLNHLNIKIFYEDKPIIEGISSIELIEGPKNTIENIVLSFYSPEDEAFYGFGERYNAINQRGQKLDTRVYEQYKNHGLRTYLPMPLFISSKGYGLVLESLRYSAFDLAQKNRNMWTVEVELGKDTELKAKIILGNPNNLLGIISKLNSLIGRPVLPPNWAFGLWISSNEWNSQSLVEQVIQQNNKYNIPASVIVLEAWSDENTFYIWNDAKYSPNEGKEIFQYSDFDYPSSGKWPNPKKFVEQLHNSGLHVLLWQIPILKKNEEKHLQLDNDINHMVEMGYCVMTEENEPYRIRPFWFNGGLLMDFTSPDGVNWWMDKRKYLLEEIGIDGFKTDGGEHIWGRDLIFSDGRKSDEVWNEYPNLYAETYYNIGKKYKPDAITFSRAGFTGAQSFPCHWAGDENSTWEAFRRSIFAGLNAGISGVTFWGWDFAGFSGEIPSAELYLRATAMATFSPIMQYHSEYNHHKQPSNDRTPWNIAQRSNQPEVISIFRFFANLRMNLLPYILQSARSSSVTGQPMIRALCIVNPEDKNISTNSYQYMFGDSLLVSPIVEPDLNEIEVYLPEGDWISFWDIKKYSGLRTHTLPSKLDEIPVFIRENSLIPLNLNEDYNLGGNVGNNTQSFKNLCFVFCPGLEGNYKWHCEKTGEEIEFYWEQKSPESFVLKIEKIYRPIQIIITDDYVFDQDFKVLDNGRKVLSLPNYTKDHFEITVNKN